LEESDVNFSKFYEPDMNNELTSITVEPGEKSAKILKKLPLALKNTISRTKQKEVIS